eukprot:TRINITY_DN2179_c0_g1_i3.p1 TRINITY_DN2179_c0_g1~~TRINITY_DN2179_c0_g1_i3.p1  ORF type:complete len:225 (-),score=32.02 TRINITY_DN2179_c0_g1_i3:124-798(-)
MGLSAHLSGLVLELVSSVQAMGPIGGPIAFVLLLTVWVVVGLPCTLLNMVPGFLFGFETGVICNILGKVAGSMVSFFIARIFRERVDSWGNKRKAYRIVAKAVDKGGFLSICLVRLLYIPMPLKNYGLGALGAPAGQTLVASTICALPFAIMWTWAGSKCKSLAEVFAQPEKSGGSKMPRPEYIAVGLVGLVIIYFARKAAYASLPMWIKEELESKDEPKDKKA